MIDILGWAPDRQTLINALTTTDFPDDDRIPDKWRGQMLATLNDAGELVCLPDINLSEIGPVVKIPGVYDPDGTEITPPVMIAGHHVNFRIGHELAEVLRHGLPQYDADGNLLTVWERTHLLALIPELTETTLTEIGEDGQTGYVGLSGLKLYDPRVVTNPARRWL